MTAWAKSGPSPLTPIGIHDIVDCARYLERSRRTLKGVAKGAIVSLLGGRRGLTFARAFERSCGAGSPVLTVRCP